MSRALYLDTSVVLRATLETGTSPELERALGEAEILIVSRLALVEASRALLRLRALGRIGDTAVADVRRHLDELWSRCEIWELGRGVCEAAESVAPSRHLRTLDALHLATFLAARRHIADLELLTADERLAAAAGARLRV